MSMKITLIIFLCCALPLLNKNVSYFHIRLTLIIYFQAMKDHPPIDMIMLMLLTENETEPVVASTDK
ncbi:unnamed protein product [Amoebophrya sp. A25]|nr:unnamed protein product [Amoebophrya sp. A25]|eukprot:GSA25T00004462001.1